MAIEPVPSLTVVPRRPATDDDISEAWSRGRQRAYQSGAPHSLEDLHFLRHSVALWLRDTVIDQDVALHMLIRTVELTHRLDLYLNDHLDDNRAIALREAAEVALRATIAFLRDSLPQCSVSQDTIRTIDP